MDNKETEQAYEKWQRCVMNVNVALTLICIVVEMIAFLTFLYKGKIETGVLFYVMVYIVLPSILNIIAIVIGYFLINNDRIEDSIKNYIPNLVSLIMALSIACVHNLFPVVIVAYAISIILTSVYGDRKLTRGITGIGFVFMIISTGKAMIDGRFDNLDYGINYLISFAMVVASYYATPQIIKYESIKRKMFAASIEEKEDLEKKLLNDNFTGLYNHTAFYSMLALEIDRIKQDGKALAVAVIDLDDFKMVNDYYGHRAGESVLLAFTGVLKKYCSDMISASRYGGEEFAIIFTEVAAENPAYIMEKIREDFNDISILEMEKEKVTFSCGLAYWKSGMSAENLFTAADSAMYQAKEKGKNCIVTVS